MKHAMAFIIVLLFTYVIFAMSLPRTVFHSLNWKRVFNNSVDAAGGVARVIFGDF